VSRFGLEASDESVHIVGVTHHKDDVNVGSLDDIVTNSDGMRRLCSSQAALHNRFAQRISKEQKPLFKTKRAEQYAPVRVLFHRLRQGALAIASCYVAS
jgi:hypothetical protein